jgi:hypothetical protein
MNAESKTNATAPDESNGSGLPLSTQHPALSTHRIRLGPPWEVTPDGVRTRHARNFGRPRTLDPGERVWLVCEGLPATTEVTLNGVAVGQAPAGAFVADITDYLRPRNTVVFAVAGGGALGSVALEMRLG